MQGLVQCVSAVATAPAHAVTVSFQSLHGPSLNFVVHRLKCFVQIQHQIIQGIQRTVWRFHTVYQWPPFYGSLAGSLFYEAVADGVAGRHIKMNQDIFLVGEVFQSQVSAGLCGSERNFSVPQPYFPGLHPMGYPDMQPAGCVIFHIRKMKADHTVIWISRILRQSESSPAFQLYFGGACAVQTHP